VQHLKEVGRFGTLNDFKEKQVEVLTIISEAVLPETSGAYQQYKLQRGQKTEFLDKKAYVALITMYEIRFELLDNLLFVHFYKVGFWWLWNRLLIDLMCGCLLFLLFVFLVLLFYLFGDLDQEL